MDLPSGDATSLTTSITIKFKEVEKIKLRLNFFFFFFFWKFALNYSEQIFFLFFSIFSKLISIKF
jgi:hypothetical protein